MAEHRVDVDRSFTWIGLRHFVFQGRRRPVRGGCEGAGFPVARGTVRSSQSQFAISGSHNRGLTS